MREDAFFESGESDFFGLPTRRINEQMVHDLRRGPLGEVEDVEAAVPLAYLIHADLEKYGTGGGEEMTDPQMREALLALSAIANRLGVTSFSVPFRDFTSFRSWWLRNDGHGSYQARRDLLNGVFEPLHEEFAVLEQRSLTNSLVEPVSPHHRTGWTGVDAEIGELRRHFHSARTAQDYRNVGNDCVSVTEALSRQVYDPSRHLREGEQEPPVANTKQRLDRFVDDAMPGSDNAALRKLAKASIEFAQHVKHSSTPTRREAGIGADAVIQLANLLRRLDQDL